MPSALSQTVIRPVIPNDATNANASATPPNWARTPQSEVTKRLVTLLALAVLTAYARTPPMTAPANAVTAESTTELRSARSTAGEVSPSTLARVKELSESRKAPTTTTRVGIRRKTV